MFYDWNTNIVGWRLFPKCERSLSWNDQWISRCPRVRNHFHPLHSFSRSRGFIMFRCILMKRINICFSFPLSYKWINQIWSDSPSQKLSVCQLFSTPIKQIVCLNGIFSYFSILLYAKDSKQSSLTAGKNPFLPGVEYILSNKSSIR